MICSRCRRRQAEFCYRVGNVTFVVCPSCVWTKKLAEHSFAPLPQRSEGHKK